MASGEAFPEAWRRKAPVSLHSTPQVLGAFLGWGNHYLEAMSTYLNQRSDREKRRKAKLCNLIHDLKNPPQTIKHDQESLAQVRSTTQRQLWVKGDWREKRTASHTRPHIRRCPVDKSGNKSQVERGRKRKRKVSEGREKRKKRGRRKETNAPNQPRSRRPA